MARVLLVDDDPALLRALTALLSDTYRHEVRTAKSGREALSIMREWIPEVVITDIIMEPMDGIELGQEIISDRTFDGVRLVILSGYDDDTRRFVAKQAGFEEFLTKPVGGKELHRVIMGTQRSPTG